MSLVTLTQLKQIVDFKIQKQCDFRQMPHVTVGDGEFKVYYDLVVDELMRELKINRIFTELSLTPVTVFTEYALGASYSGYISHEITFTGISTRSTGLQLKSLEELPTAGELTQGTPHSMAIYAKNDGLHYVYLYPLVGNAGTLKINHYIQGGIDVGAGASADLTKDIDLPVQYHPLVIEGILAQIFPDMSAEYYMKLDNMRTFRLTPSKGYIEYNFGGLDEDDYDNGFSKNFNGES